jgi:hypothetical protein
MAIVYDRLQPMLMREASRLGVPHGERRTLIADTLRGLLLALARRGATRPDSLIAYATVALRHARSGEASRRARLARLEWELRQDVVVHGKDVVQPVEPEVASAPADPPWRHTRVLGSLADALQASLTVEEVQLAAWLAEMVPQRDVATWLGITHAAARQRITRLRTRLRRLAGSIAATMSPADQRELDRFFRRAGVFPPSTLTRRASRGRSATDAETS